MIKHRWYEVIVAWAEGQEIECKDIVYKNAHWGPWVEDEDEAGPINWNNPDYIFRIKGHEQMDMDGLDEALDMLTLMIETVRGKMK
jgi:hypothetical protein